MPCLTWVYVRMIMILIGGLTRVIVEMADRVGAAECVRARSPRKSKNARFISNERYRARPPARVHRGRAVSRPGYDRHGARPVLIAVQTIVLLETTKECLCRSFR